MTEEKTSMQSVSDSYRSRGAAFTEPLEDGVDTEQVQRQNHSEHAGGERSEPVEPSAATVPNTVNDPSLAATREADEHQDDPDLAEPETDGVGEPEAPAGEPQDDGPFPGE